MYSCLNCWNGSEPYVRIMSYTRWNALRATDGVSATRSRYSQNVPSQCCSRNRVVSSRRSRMLVSGFDAAVDDFAMVSVSVNRACARPRARLPGHPALDTRDGGPMEFQERTSRGGGGRVSDTCG